MIQNIYIALMSTARYSAACFKPWLQHGQGTPHYHFNDTKPLHNSKVDKLFKTLVQAAQQADAILEANRSSRSTPVAPTQTTAYSPHLLRDASGAQVGYTSHTLKQCKVALYGALLLHTDYLVEAGAHAGSELERLSVAGAMNHARIVRPSGLAVALRYARGARSQNIVQVDRLAYEAAREWVASVGIEGLPRRGGWAALTNWALNRVSASAAFVPPKPIMPTHDLGVEEHKPETVGQDVSDSDEE